MRMAFYGTLRQGAANHYEVRNIEGEWSTGTVRGWLYEITWGPADGFPGITLDAHAPPVEVDVLAGPGVEKNLGRIDDFEGPGYRRVSVAVTLLDGTLLDGTVVEAEIYEADPEA